MLPTPPAIRLGRQQDVDFDAGFDSPEALPGNPPTLKKRACSVSVLRGSCFRFVSRDVPPYITPIRKKQRNSNIVMIDYSHLFLKITYREVARTGALRARHVSVYKYIGFINGRPLKTSSLTRRATPECEHQRTKARVYRFGYSAKRERRECSSIQRSLQRTPQSKRTISPKILSSSIRTPWYRYLSWVTISTYGSADRTSSLNAEPAGTTVSSTVRIF